MRTRFSALLALLLLLPLGMAAQETPEGEAADEEDEKSEFEKAIDGASLQEGFFDIYRKDGELLLVVPEDRLGDDFLMTHRIEQGIGSNFVYGGWMLGVGIVALEEREGKILLVGKPTQFVATDRATQNAVDLTFGNSIIESGKIVATDEESGVRLVDIHGWIVSDLSGVGEMVRRAVARPPAQRGSASLDAGRSYLETVKSFPLNIAMVSQLTFKPSQPAPLRSLADSRFIPVSIYTQFAALPETPMARREADERVGYFMTVHKDFSRDEAEDFFVRYVDRWRLECAGPVGSDGLCDPVKPITYYLEHTVPEQYRQVMMEAIEAFVPAFEAAGFRNGIVAEMLPEGADAEDIRYATLRWNVSDQAGYGAIGPHISDPRTGEVLDADILFEASMVTGFRNAWRNLVNPSTALDEMLNATPEELDGLAHGAEMAGFGAEFQAQGGLIKTMLVASGEIDASDPVPWEYVNQALKWVTMHEVGHTLGLRHNFRSSYDTPNDRLYDRNWAEERGVFSSVMEYPTPNVPSEGQSPGYYYNPGMGTYDVWAIAYGYTPDAEHARELARESAKPGHAYGTDEDARGAGAIDPTVSVYDLGQDPLAWSRGRADLIRKSFNDVPKFALEDNISYANVTAVYRTLLNQYARALAPAAKYIGGQYQYRDRRGDDNERGPFVNVEKSRQVEALDFLAEYAFSADAFALDEDVLQQFGANRWSHWGNTNTVNGRIDYPFHEQVLGIQTSILDRVIHPWVFSRIRDAEAKFGADEVVGIPELMDGVTEAVWSEVLSGSGDIASLRRDLQRVHLSRMVTYVTEAPARTPADARSVARLVLGNLHGSISARLEAGGVDAYTKAHLLESNARIAAALHAGLDLGN